MTLTSAVCTPTVLDAWHRLAETDGCSVAAVPENALGWASGLSVVDLTDLPVFRPEYIRMAWRGKFVRRSKYVRLIDAGATCALIESVDIDAIRQLLGNGATLVVNHLEHWHTGVRRVASALSARAAQPCEAVGFEVFGEEGGFPRHRDPTDSLVVQLAGRKLWRVWDDGAAGTERSVILTRGNVLRVPAGTDHQVQPEGDDGSLHLTFAVAP